MLGLILGSGATIVTRQTNIIAFLELTFWWLEGKQTDEGHTQCHSDRSCEEDWAGAATDILVRVVLKGLNVPQGLCTGSSLYLEFPSLRHLQCCSLSLVLECMLNAISSETSLASL